MNTSTVLDSIFKIEKELNLFEKTVQDVYIWKLVRFELSQSILIQLNLLLKEKTEKDTILKKVSRAMSLFINTINYPSLSKKTDTILLENPRKVKDKDGNYYDPYTKYFVSELIKKNKNFEIIDLGYKGIHYEKADDHRKYADNFYYDIFNRLFKKNI